MRVISDDLQVIGGYKVLVKFELSRADSGERLTWKDIPSPMKFVAEGGEVSEPLNSGVVGMQAGESKRLLVYGEPEEGTNELWDFLDEKRPPFELPVYLDITLLQSRVEQVSDGVLVQSLIPGDGRTFAKKGDRISIQYTGRLVRNGKKFDSTYDRGRRALTFQVGVGKVIPGLDAAVMKLSQGQKALITIPSVLAYGSKGYGKTIPPDSDLVFEIQVESIVGYAF